MLEIANTLCALTAEKYCSFVTHFKKSEKNIHKLAPNEINILNTVNTSSWNSNAEN